MKYGYQLKNNNKAEQIKKKRKDRSWSTNVPALDVAFLQPRSWPSVRAVMIIIRTNWVLWFSQTQRCNVNVPHRGRDTLTPAPRYPLVLAGHWIWRQILLDVDMWEDGTDHVLHRWCLLVWWDHRRGLAERWQTLLVPLLDILKVMYIKAELFWLGRCQHTFIWSVRHDEFHLKNATLKVCTFCFLKRRKGSSHKLHTKSSKY